MLVSGSSRTSRFSIRRKTGTAASSMPLAFQSFRCRSFGRPARAAIPLPVTRVALRSSVCRFFRRASSAMPRSDDVGLAQVEDFQPGSCAMWPMLKSVTETLQRPESVRCWPETLNSLSAGNDFSDGSAAPLILFPPNDEMLEVIEILQELEEVVVDPAVADVQESEPRHLRDVLEDRAGHLRAAQVQVLEVLPVFQVGDSLVRDGFRVVQVEHLHVLQRGQVLQAQVRDLRVGQVDALAVAAGAPASPGRRPSPRCCSGRRRSSLRRHRGSSGRRVRRSPRAGSSSAGGDGRRRGRAEPHEPPAHHAANHGHSCIVSEVSGSTSRGADQLRRRLGSLDFGSKMISHSGTASRTCR